MVLAAAVNGARAEHAFFNIVGGESRTAEHHHRVTDPRTEEELWEVPSASNQDLDDAVRVAHQAFKTWRKKTVAERHVVMKAVSKVLNDNAELLSSILMQETGKSKLMAEHEIQRATSLYDYYTTVQLEDEIQFEDDEVQIVATHAPYGVIGAISPWNFPLILSSFKVSSALATGNCVIIKPSPFTPYTILKFCELAQAVVPTGVFQALNGGVELGEAMTLHPGIAHISFTGTIAVGQRIMANCARTLKKVILELAGNDAAIVTDDVDVDAAAAHVALGCFLHAGQMCVASKRVYVHARVYDAFLAALVRAAADLAAIREDPAAPSVFGPLSNRANYDRCRGFVDDCRRNGYEFVTGGAAAPPTEKGFWIAPTIVANPPEDSLLVREEQFGPIVPVLTWTDEADVIARANLDNAGLGGAVFCRDVERARRIADELETGTVWINRPEEPHPNAFFAGQKLSGVGGELGKQGLLSYCHTRSYHIAKK